MISTVNTWESEKRFTIMLSVRDLNQPLELERQSYENIFILLLSEMVFWLSAR